jgi:hypothetical protein
MKNQTQKPVSWEQITKWCSIGSAILIVIGFVFQSPNLTAAEGELLPFQQQALELQQK